MKKNLILVAMACIALSACSSYSGSSSLIAGQNDKFVLIPFVNHSNTPMASKNVETIVSSVMKEKGMRYTAYNSENEALDLKDLLDDNFDRKQALEWMKSVEYTYVVTGSVDEWNYKSGLDGEPVVSVTVEIRDRSGAVVYQKTGSRSGFGRESLNTSGQNVISNIFDDINFK
ncbi:MAG: hypothetical protein ACI4NE_00450 [Succinivibrio sp.]